MMTNDEIEQYKQQGAREAEQRLYEGGEKRFIELLTVNGGITFAESFTDDAVLFRVPRETINKFYSGELQASDLIKTDGENI